MRARRFLLPFILLFSLSSFSQADKPPVPIHQPPADSVYLIADSMAEFPGGMSELLMYIAKNLNYPCTNEEFQGTVYISFIVETDGSITDVKIIRGVSGMSSLDKEAIRVVKSFPKWKPAKQNGKPVRVKYNIPIRFSLH